MPNSWKSPRPLRWLLTLSGMCCRHQSHLALFEDLTAPLRLIVLGVRRAH